jgi:hypothetical protein
MNKNTLKNMFDALMVIAFIILLVAMLGCKTADAAPQPTKTFCTEMDRGAAECVTIIKLSMARVAPDIVQVARYEFSYGDRPESYVEQEVQVNCETHKTLTLMVDRSPFPNGEWHESMGVTEDNTIDWICKQKMPNITNAEDEGAE